jgi:hypothetical protein
MIYGITHQGSGLANQLHRIIATRILAKRLNTDFSIIARDLFKGKDFMNVDMGEENLLATAVEFPSGKIKVLNSELPLWEEWGKHTYDPDFNFVEDNTIIDGNFEDERYFENHLDKVDEWLRVKEWNIPDDVCVIGFRGGEYYTVPELGLPFQWYYEAMIKMVKEVNPEMKFEVHTDDPILAKQFFPDLNIIHDVELNWRAMRYAKYAIIANSSFYVLPRILSKGITIAPRYWNRYNTKKWDYPQGYYKEFQYI